jgi:hypothetical protein
VQRKDEEKKKKKRMSHAEGAEDAEKTIMDQSLQVTWG